jgi:hypothetical protein
VIAPKDLTRTMTADIKYTVKYHPRLVKKVANVFFGVAAVIILLLDLIWAPFRGLTPEMQALAFSLIIPEIFWDMNIIAILSLTIGFVLRRFRWRSGKIELTGEKLIIDGSYYVSIWLKNMWEVDVQDTQFHGKQIRLNSNVDAVLIKFDTEQEFEDFGETLIQHVALVENIKLKTTTDE